MDIDTKTNELERQLVLMKGQLEATTQLLAAFIAASPDADAFVRDVLPYFAQSLESARQGGQNSQAHLDGWHEPQKILSEWIGHVERIKRSHQ